MPSDRPGSREQNERSPERDREHEKLALSLLGIVLVALLVLTWQKWGDVTIDCGREMYVPWQILQGKRLYLDLWYPYGPLVPHFQALLFQLFGVHLTVLYGFGISMLVVTTLGVWQLARKFLPVPLSFLAAFLVLIQSIQPKLFNFILPYSYAGVAGTMLSVLTVLLCVSLALDGRTALRVAGLGILAGAAVLTKAESGIACACMAVLAILAETLEHRSFRKLAIDLLLFSPGLLLAAGVYAGYVNLSSFSLIFEENIPVSSNAWFVRLLGKKWLSMVGFPATFQQFLTGVALGSAAYAFWVLVLRTGSRIADKWRLIAGALFLSIVAVAALALWRTGASEAVVKDAFDLVRAVFFTSGVVWMSGFVAVMALAGLIREPRAGRHRALLSLSAAALLVGARVGNAPSLYGFYSIFYNLVPYVSWLVLLWRSSGEAARKSGRMWIEFACLSCAVHVLLASPHFRDALHRNTPVETAVGTIKLTSEKAAAYREVLSWAAGANARGERWMTLPEDISLYSFSQTSAPDRMYVLLPGLLAPGPLTDRYLRTLEAEGLRYILLSNRRSPEYGFGSFGQGYNEEVLAWIHANYQPVRTFGAATGWNAVLWERSQVR